MMSIGHQQLLMYSLTSGGKMLNQSTSLVHLVVGWYDQLFQKPDENRPIPEKPRLGCLTNIQSLLVV